MRITSNNIQSLNENEIFVFGSNEFGKHYGGGARVAFDKFGAIIGQSSGLQGQSYALNSMNGLKVLKEQVDIFIEFAKNNTHLIFMVTEVGTGIAGHTHKSVASLFEHAIEIENIYLPEKFLNEIL